MTDVKNNNHTASSLFTPVELGAIQLGHRVVMAPLTRSRAEQPSEVPGPIMLEYYGQRASSGGLIISEATPISTTARGWFGAPGIYNEAQVISWRKIVDAVHARGGKMILQLWHTGRSSHVSMTGGPAPVSASVNPGYWQDQSHLVSTRTGWAQPSPHRALEISEIPQIIEDYRAAAVRAKAAGFDGVELHGANGYLLDQFLQDNSNHRTDAYGGSIENRARLLLEAVEAVASVFGGNRTAVRIAPGGSWNDMADSNPTALFTYVAEQLNPFGLAYLHIVEPRIKGNIEIADGQAPVASQQLRKNLYGQDRRCRRISSGHGRGDRRERRCRCGGVRAVLRFQPRSARTDQDRREAESVRPRHVLHIRCTRLHGLSVASISHARAGSPCHVRADAVQSVVVAI